MVMSWEAESRTWKLVRDAKKERGKGFSKIGTN